MEKNWHRRFITSKKTELSQSTKLEDRQLLDHLVQGNVITENEKSRLGNDRLGTDYDRASELYELLPSRVSGYEKMMEALKLTNQGIARGILMEGLRLNDEQAWKGLQLQEEQEQRGIFQNTVESSMTVQVFEVPEHPSLEALATGLEIQELFTKEVYDYIFKGKSLEICFPDKERSEHDADFPSDAIILPRSSRGWMGICNIYEFDNEPEKVRLGSLNDVRNLKKFFEDLDFTVFPFKKTELEGKRKTKQDVMKFLADFKNKCKSDDPASIILFIGSHGCHLDGSLISTSNHQPIRVEDIVKEFYRSNCPPQLVGIPKIIFSQACQRYASVPDDGTTPEDAEDFNIILFEATSPGKFAYRDTKKGSWFVLCFISAMQQHGKEKSLQEVMKITKEMVEKLKVKSVVTDQVPLISKNTMKPLYFNI